MDFYGRSSDLSRKLKPSRKNTVAWIQNHNAKMLGFTAAGTVADFHGIPF